MVENDNAIRNLTPDKLAVANVAFYLRLLNVLEEGASGYYCWMMDQSSSNRISRREERLLKRKALLILENLYHSRGDKAEIEKFKLDWGGEGEVFEQILDSLSPTIETTRDRVLTEAESWTPWNRVGVAIGAGSRFLDLSKEQKTKLLIMAGYTGEELQSLRLFPKVVISGGVSFGLGWVYESLGISAAAYGGFNPFLEGYSDPGTIFAVAGAYGLYYSTLLINAQQNLRLLKNRSIANSPNISATVAFYLLSKFLPNDETISGWSKKHQFGKFLSNRESIRDWGTRWASFALEPIRELGWFGSALISPSAIVAANTVGFLLNGTQALLAEAVLRSEIWLHRSHQKD